MGLKTSQNLDKDISQRVLKSGDDHKKSRLSAIECRVLFSQLCDCKVQVRKFNSNDTNIIMSVVAKCTEHLYDTRTYLAGRLPMVNTWNEQAGSSNGTSPRPLRSICNRSPTHLQQCDVEIHRSSCRLHSGYWAFLSLTIKIASAWSNQEERVNESHWGLGCLRGALRELKTSFHNARSGITLSSITSPQSVQGSAQRFISFQNILMV